MRNWSKAMGTVLGIVLGSFSIAAITTLLNEKLCVKRVLSNADSSQELLIPAPTIITSSTIGLRVVQIDFEQAPWLMPSPTQESSHQTSSIKFPLSNQFLVKHRLAFGEVNPASSLWLPEVRVR